MKCLNCGKELDDNVSKCPFCGYDKETESIDKDGVIELPDLKEETSVPTKDEGDLYNPFQEQLLGKTIAISKEDMEDDSSLLDDFNKQMDLLSSEEPVLENDSINTNDLKEINEELNKNVIETNNNDKEEIDPNLNDSQSTDVLKTKDSMDKRRKIFYIMGTITLILALGLVAFIFAFAVEPDEEVDFSSEYIKALDVYYETNDLDDVTETLEKVKNDDDLIMLQGKTRTVCDSWIIRYLNEDVKSREDFEEVTNKYRDLVSNLYNNVKITIDGKAVSILSDSDYIEVTEELTTIYRDSEEYYNALDYYNNKDYNKAYYIFGKVREDNSYYEKSVNFRKRIINDVLSLLKKDIEKIEAGFEDKELEEQLQVYYDVESVILEYNNIYDSISLSDDKEYQQLLSLYTSRVKEYRKKIEEANKNEVDTNNESVVLE